MLGCSKGQRQARATGVGWLRVEATYSFAQGCLRSLQALSQDVPEHERCEDD
jgi:hypothetical protein